MLNSKNNPDRRQFLADLFRQAHKARTWLTIDLDIAAKNLQQPRERLVRAFDYLRDQQMLELKVAGVRHRYRVLKKPDDLEALAHHLYELSQQREQRELERLQQILDWISQSACQTASLSAHFDSPLEQDCGHCSWCQTQQAALLAERRFPDIAESTWQQANEVRQQHSKVLANAVVFTRFLCGISSPKLSRAKLTSHALFGKLENVPFQTVLSHIS